ncbi:carboxymuconolactone decarboxylase family protein [Pseudomonas sp. JS3066]|uniref:carboxymuconolactone decarboxylase family protein n=1 Tax=unclassified Pseudomonas TaxID=196821 RepID=UPI000EA8C0D0|nr:MULTISPECIES: carboxymuconolactone decarboxylase family protein [unclassified Pseudomonas]AYF86119.1 carboxymuconolactone decarboxylase family protein [Pseudomonas sp. DY-1]WVK91291.1 carboxymuconolactone decarboxylase family protein [Pseudomonas sp. JS3066]
MNEPRIQPAQPPYDTAIQAAFDRVMPPGVPPLLLFRCVARNPRVLQRMMAGGLLDRGSIGLRERELLILRSTARCGAEYEWGVHVAAFNAKAGFSQAQLDDTCQVTVEPSLWEGSELALLALADALHECADIDDGLWRRLREYFSEEQLIECVMLAGFYHAVSFLAKGLRVELEAHAPRFPSDRSQG